MYRYAQINSGTGDVVSDSHLSGPVDRADLIPVPDDFDIWNKRYVNGEWVEEELAEPEEPEPTEQELINAEILQNQAEMLSNQNAADEALAEILLNQIGG